MEDNYFKVVPSYPFDSGKGFARISPEMADKYELKEDDIIKIIGNRLTYAKLKMDHNSQIIDKSSYPLIRLDLSTKRNAIIDTDDYIQIEKVDQYKNAEVITFAPVERSLPTDIPYIEKFLLNTFVGRIVIRGDICDFEVMAQKFPLFIYFTSPDEDDLPLIITENTEIRFRKQKIDDKDFQVKTPSFRVSFDDIGGLHIPKEKIIENVIFPLLYPEVYQQLGISPPRGILIHGPPGTGKSLLGMALVSEIDAHFIAILGPEINSQMNLASIELAKIFKEAEDNAPSIILIDELESLAQKRKDLVYDTMMKNTLSELVHLMDNHSNSQVIIIGITNNIEAIEPTLRRSGRFDTEIKVSIPNSKERLEILQILTKNMALDESVKLNVINSMVQGFSGADLAALCREAGLKKIREERATLLHTHKKRIPFENLSRLQITQENFLDALNNLKPSSLREVVLEIPIQKWNDIGGLKEVKALLKEAVEYPLKFGELYSHMGARSPKGVLFFGLPGTGKTTLARAVASECKANFISIKGPELLNKWLGESEAAVRDIFNKARQSTPCVIFFDEIDALTPIRGRGETNVHVERVVSQLLAEMDGLENQIKNEIFIIGATNRPELIDPAILRPGRLGVLIHIPLPDFKARESIFKVHTRLKPVAEDVWYSDLAKRTQGYSGADVESICDRAATLAIREIIAQGAGKIPAGPLTQWTIKKYHFDKALEEISTSVKLEDENKYKDMVQRKIKHTGTTESPRLYM